jgi:NADPH-dependent curcumin reductase CurA
MQAGGMHFTSQHVAAHTVTAMKFTTIEVLHKQNPRTVILSAAAGAGNKTVRQNAANAAQQNVAAMRGSAGKGAYLPSAVRFRVTDSRRC